MTRPKQPPWPLRQFVVLFCEQHEVELVERLSPHIATQVGAPPASTPRSGLDLPRRSASWGWDGRTPGPASSVTDMHCQVMRRLIHQEPKPSRMAARPTKIAVSHHWNAQYRLAG